MKLRIRAKLLSVHSEVEVSTTDEEVVYCADTDPLSSPRLTRLKDAEYRELATITTARLDAKDRAHHIVMADGHTRSISSASSARLPVRSRATSPSRARIGRS